MIRYFSKSVASLFVLPLLLLITLLFSAINNRETWGKVPQARAATSADANVKVAFIGDAGNGSNFVSVLNLIKNEGAQFVLHQGDFDYSFNATSFFSKVDTGLGANFPYFASVGNHDINSWRTTCADADGCYATFLKDRMARIGVNPDDPNLDDEMYSVVFKGIKFVFVGQDSVSAGDNTYAPYIQSQLQNDDHIWKVCSWHKNQKLMQIGGKGDEMGWKVYETCKNLGAIIATGHEHSYERTKTLTSMQNQTVDLTCADPAHECVSPGRTFAFVSGLGGNSVRDQQLCLSANNQYPYGCKGEWAKIYTTNQDNTTGQYGALFITFNVNGDPYKAHGYFKNIKGQIIDDFDITASANSVTAAPTVPLTNTPTRTPTLTPTRTLTPTSGPTSTPTRTPTLTPTRTPTITPSRTPTGIPTSTITQSPLFTPTLGVATATPISNGSCSADINGDHRVDLVDYSILIQNFLKTPVLDPRADLNRDGIVDLRDYSILVSQFLKLCNASTATPSQTQSVTPLATNTRTPTITPSRTPTSTVALNPTATMSMTSGGSTTVIGDISSSPYGIYPNCVAPAVGLEDHSWWWQPGETYPRHLHIAACAPNARDTSGNLVAVNGDVPIILRVMMFNNPGRLTWVRGGYVDTGSLSTQNCPGAPFCITLNPNLQCQSAPNEMKECTWYFGINFKTDPTVTGLKELRLSPNVEHDDLATRQFATLNFQIYLKGSGAPSNYRASADPIVRAWYTGFNYANFAWTNYVGLLGADLSKNIPTVKGIVPLQVKHSEGTNTQVSKLFLDPNFHKYPQYHIDAQVGVPGPEGALLLYQNAGLFQGTYNWDTTKVSNGLHYLYFQTEDRIGEGTTFGGMNAGAMKVQVNVQN